MRTIIMGVYLVAGLVVASTNDYLERLTELKPIVSAVLAILLWPLVLLGVNLHLGEVMSS